MKSLLALLSRSPSVSSPWHRVPCKRTHAKTLASFGAFLQPHQRPKTLKHRRVLNKRAQETQTKYWKQNKTYAEAKSNHLWVIQALTSFPSRTWLLAVCTYTQSIGAEPTPNQSKPQRKGTESKQPRRRPTPACAQSIMHLQLVRGTGEITGSIVNIKRVVPRTFAMIQREPTHQPSRHP
ncbi:hypothetical protein B0T25DRAFT_339719 [Lasiosphaeria hispida]|uniref:Uncharacterized protein n=1 Tax=Lasiosphaeria hispida TaxID=260671 RepID=A0AAJ0H685_9PEZI|nr:hypothetical protein B0T25DRAFT_339719 [Lasiosphaeria hispida]